MTAPQPPALRTLLDLALDDSETVEVETGSAGLQVLMGLERVEQANPAAAFKRVDAIRQDKFESEVASWHGSMARMFLHRLVQRAPTTVIGAPLMSLVNQLAGNPAGAVLWAHAVAAHWARTGKPVGIGAVLRHLDGRLPAPHAVQALWLAQKVAYEDRPALRAAGLYQSDNWLDHAAAWAPAALKAGAA